MLYVTLAACLSAAAALLYAADRAAETRRLRAENERLAATVREQADIVARLYAERATLQGLVENVLSCHCRDEVY